MTLGTKALTSKPGEFKAVCKLPEWVGMAVLLAMDPMPAKPVRERWSQGLRRNEALVVCDVTFTDAVSFEAHMREVHGKTTRGQIFNDQSSYMPIKCWPAKPPRGGAGRPFESTKAVTQSLRACPTCDLHGEVLGIAGELWWREHVRGCALFESGRQLANQRDDLIAQGVDPSALAVPIAPDVAS